MKDSIALCLTLALAGCTHARGIVQTGAPGATIHGREAARSRIERLLGSAGVSRAARDPQAPAAAAGSLELKIRWASAAGSGSPRAGARSGNGEFTTVRAARSPEAWVPERIPELAADRLVAAAVDRQGRLRAWSIVADPRVLRAESPDATGKLSGETLYRTEAEFLVLLPNDPSIAEVRLFLPRWTGQDYTLEPLGTASIAIR